MYKEATKVKLRFSTAFGIFTVEDLWKLSLSGDTSLDRLAVDLKKQLDDTTDGSLIPGDKEEDKILSLKFKIAYDILTTRVNMKKEAERKAASEAKNAEITSIIKRKTFADMEGKSIEELEKLLQNEDVSDAVEVSNNKLNF